MCAQIEWHLLYPLTEVAADTYRFPDSGLYHDETLVFTRGARGKATKVRAAGIDFMRRAIDGEDGRTFRIRPERPVEELRKVAVAATPPKPQGELATSDSSNS